MLAPSIDGPAGPGPLHRQSCARDLYPRFLADLLDRTGVDVPLDRSGILELAGTEEELEHRAARAGTGAERLDAARPGRAGAGARGGTPAPSCTPTTARWTTCAHGGAGRRRGARRRASPGPPDEVGVAGRAGQRCRRSRSRGGTRYASRHLVLAAGAWAGDPAGPPAPPPRSSGARAARPPATGSPIRHVTYGGAVTSSRARHACSSAPRARRSASTAPSRRAGRPTLRALAARRAAGAGPRARLAEHWAGLRPMTPDGSPFLGADPDYPALCTPAATRGTASSSPRGPPSRWRRCWRAGRRRRSSRPSGWTGSRARPRNRSTRRGQLASLTPPGPPASFRSGNTLRPSPGVRSGLRPWSGRRRSDRPTVRSSARPTVRPAEMGEALYQIMGRHRAPALPERKPSWLKVKAPGGPNYLRLKQLMRGAGPPHGVRGGALPERRRVLGARHRDVHDPRRRLHAELRLLRGRPRTAAEATTPRSPTAWPKPRPR